MPACGAFDHTGRRPRRRSNPAPRGAIRDDPDRLTAAEVDAPRDRSRLRKEPNPPAHAQPEAVAPALRGHAVRMWEDSPLDCGAPKPAQDEPNHRRAKRTHHAHHAVPGKRVATTAIPRRSDPGRPLAAPSPGPVPGSRGRRQHVSSGHPPGAKRTRRSPDGPPGREWEGLPDGSRARESRPRRPAAGASHLPGSVARAIVPGTRADLGRFSPHAPPCRVAGGRGVSRNERHALARKGAGSGLEGIGENR